MPISQDRLLALISIVDEVLGAHTRLRGLISQETQEATAEYHQLGATSVASILAHLQSAEALANEPYLSPTSIETLAREREHFRLTRARNIRARESANRKRNGLTTRATRNSDHVY
jgi:hypothetical protein